MTGKNASESMKPIYEGYFSKIHWRKEPQDFAKGENRVQGSILEGHKK